MPSQFSDPTLSQDSFVAIPNKTAGQYRFDFARNFFLSPEAEKAERSNYYAVLRELEGLKGKVADSPDHMLQAFRLYDKVLIDFMRHYTYLYLRSAVNTRDQVSSRESSEMDAEFSKRTAFLQLELVELNKQVFDTYIQQQPALKVYAFTVESRRRYQPYTLSLKEEEALSIASPLSSEWQYELYQNLLRRTQFGKIKTQSGELDVQRQGPVIASHSDRAVREAGFKKLYTAYDSQRDLYAFTLINLIRTRNRLAQLHHFDDAPEEVFFKSYWTKAQVSSLLEQIGKRANLYKRYQRLRADYAKKRLGYTDINLWDIPAAASDATTPRFTIEQAGKTVIKALSPLGTEYGHELELLLDPANGRMDIHPGDHRKSGGFSKGFPGVTTVFFSGGFTGYYKDMRVLTHESTHAVHRQLMNNNQVLPDYAAGPQYLFESFAIFHELLLPDYLYQHNTDPSRRRYFLEQFFEGKGMTIFSVAQEEAIELAIYDRVKQEKIETADDLDALTKRISHRYSIWSAKHDELKMQWITSALFYEDPLYDINYVYGSLLALKYYEGYNLNPIQFIPRYIALMKNGFDAPPALLLKRYLDIDLHDPHLVTDAVRLLENKVNLLEEEYSK